MHPDDLLAEAEDLEDYEASRRWTHKDDLPDLDAEMPARLRRAAFLRKLARMKISAATRQRLYDDYEDEPPDDDEIVFEVIDDDPPWPED